MMGLSVAAVFIPVPENQCPGNDGYSDKQVDNTRRELVHESSPFY